MRVLKWITIVVCIIFVAATLGVQFFLRNHRLDFVPKEMNVSHIIFAKEEAWGFGPGGNETGFIVYDMSQEVAHKISAEGIAYLSSFPSARLGKPHGWQGKYAKWHPTPISNDDKRWFQIPGSDKMTSEPKLLNYLDQYGFSIPIPFDMEAMFNSAIITHGNFYAYGRIGVIVVAPSIKKVFYLYAG